MLAASLFPTLKTHLKMQIEIVSYGIYMTFLA